VTPGPRAGPVASVGRAPPSPLAPAPGASRVCLDCGALLSGKFCAACGQKDEPLRRGLKDLALEFFQHPLIDTKLWRSLVPLLLRPGALTEEYLAGRRTRYVRPLKLYLTVSVTFFALLAVLAPAGAVQVNVGGPPEARAKPEVREKLHLPIAWLDERLQRKTEALEGPGGESVAKAVGQKMTERFPKAVFVLLPLSAVLFKLFWWERYFVEHLVFTLHLHTFGFAAGMLLFLKWAPVTGVFLVWSSVYAALAFKRVYQDGWGKTLGKLAGLTCAYAVLLSAAMAATAFSAMLAG
jgi:hypothetical protein